MLIRVAVEFSFFVAHIPTSDGGPDLQGFLGGIGYTIQNAPPTLPNFSVTDTPILVTGSDGQIHQAGDTYVGTDPGYSNTIVVNSNVTNSQGWTIVTNETSTLTVVSASSTAVSGTGAGDYYTISEKVKINWNDQITVTAGDGTGYTITNSGQGTINWYKYVSSTVNNSSAEFSGNSQFENHQTGLVYPAPGLNDGTETGTADTDNSGTEKWDNSNFLNSSFDGSEWSGNSGDSESNSQSDNYTDKTTTVDNVGAAAAGGEDGSFITETTTSKDTGSDNSTDKSNVQNTMNPDGTWSLNPTVFSQVSSGNDTFTSDDHLTDLLITPTSDALGTITRTDDDDTADSGSDQYSISQQETSTGTVVSETDDDDDSDGGQDEAIVTDKGEIDTNETDPGTGTVTIGVDKFTFNDDSPENYNDSDEGTAPLSTYDNFSDSTETDDYNTGDGGSDTYSASDIDTTTTIVTSPYGGTQTTTDTDTLGDQGTDGWSDSFGDDATLPPDEPGGFITEVRALG